MTELHTIRRKKIAHIRKRHPEAHRHCQQKDDNELPGSIETC